MTRRNAEPIALRGVHVLVVCDDAERCALFADALRYAGASATTSHSAADAAAMMDRLHANVIVAELSDAEARASLIPAPRARPPDGGGKGRPLAAPPAHDLPDGGRAPRLQLRAALAGRSAV